MKKWMGLEFVLLGVILLTAIIALIMLPGKPATPTLSESVNTTQTNETTQPETTEPEPTWLEIPEDRELTAKQAFVYDCQEEKFTFLKGKESSKVYPASITKLFTAYIALQYLEPETVLKAGDALQLVGAGSSVAEIKKGDKLTVKMLVEAMLLPSGNDAAYMLAVETGRKLQGDSSIGAWYAVDVFLKEMNKQAKNLGMTGTHFTNPDGYHDNDHYTTFHDLVILSKVAMENETIMTYAKVAEEQVTFENGTTKLWENTNALVNPASEYYCPIATGLKTGQTPSAGSCLLSSFEKKGARYVIGVFGCPKVEDRFEDTLQLLDETLKK